MKKDTNPTVSNKTMNSRIIIQTKHPAQNLINTVKTAENIKERPNTPTINGQPCSKSEKYS